MDEVTGGSLMVQRLNSNDPAKNMKTKVYIWDMDETLILLMSLLNGKFAQSYDGAKDAEKGSEIGKMWENHILQMCDDHFFYEHIENYNEPFLDSLSKYDDGLDLSNYDFNQDGFTAPTDDINKRKLAYRHRVIAQKYKQGLQSGFDREMIQIWDKLYEITDNYTDKWLSSALSFLEECSVGNKDPLPRNSSSADDFQHVHILVTSGSLIPSLVKCLLFKLDKIFTHENVYSSWEVGKLKCFSWIKERFENQNVQFCAIGDGWEECEAAQKMKWPFVQIDLLPGSSHRFPGLTLRTVSNYFSVIYGNPNYQASNDNDEE